MNFLRIRVRCVLKCSHLILEKTFWGDSTAINVKLSWRIGPKLIVLEREMSLPKVTVLPPSDAECKDKMDKKKKKTLLCAATSFYPDHVTVLWKIDGMDRTEGVGMDSSAVQEDNTNTYSITSRLRVSAKEWHTHSFRFTCIVRFFNGTTDLEFTADVFKTDRIEERFVASRQTAVLAYSFFIVKSCFYGIFIMVFVWKFQSSTGKQDNKTHLFQKYNSA